MTLILKKDYFSISKINTNAKFHARQRPSYDGPLQMSRGWREGKGRRGGIVGLSSVGFVGSPVDWLRRCLASVEVANELASDPTVLVSPTLTLNLVSDGGPRTHRRFVSSFPLDGVVYGDRTFSSSCKLVFVCFRCLSMIVFGCWLSFSMCCNRVC